MAETTMTKEGIEAARAESFSALVAYLFRNGVEVYLDIDDELPEYPGVKGCHHSVRDPQTGKLATGDGSLLGAALELLDGGGVVGMPEKFIRFTGVLSK